MSELPLMPRHIVEQPCGCKWYHENGQEIARCVEHADEPIAPSQPSDDTPPEARRRPRR